ncbi:MAG: family 43 glycosylhydrolase [Planctomycetes bacterium]|nr:family 43 glycosylhydrolase [Planctomycetota bacterium]
MTAVADLRLRDPFVLPIAREGLYYIFGTNCRPHAWGPGHGFTGYASADLVTCDDEFPAFRPGEGFWATQDFWAPEVFEYGGRFYLFGTIKAPDVRRGTQIFVADSPRGPFVPISAGPVTPADRECLDGTLHVDDHGEPWMVFCHEWLQICDGSMCAMRLSRDLTRAVDEPVMLFRGSDAPWARGGTDRFPDRMHYITDGPFLHRAADGSLLMLWSSFGADGYAMGIARSSGGILGPWFQREQPLYARDGGHGMLFTTFDGQLMLSLHAPNRSPGERPVFIPVDERAGELVITAQRTR